MSIACTASNPSSGVDPHGYARSLIAFSFSLALGCVSTSIWAQEEEEEAETSTEFGIQAPISDQDGHPTFASPHFNPLALHGDLVYVVNTPSDTLDVIDPSSNEVVQRINVGIDPVSVIERPNADEVWVSKPHFRHDQCH